MNLYLYKDIFFKNITYFILTKKFSVGELSKYTYDILKDSKIESYHFSNNQNLISEIDNILETGDAILIKGSHSMNLIEIVNYLK